MPRWKILGSLSVSVGLITGCTSSDLEAISAGLAQGMAEAAYEIEAASAYRAGYMGSYYAPTGFASYSEWPQGYSYGDFIGPYACTHTGSFYTCDSDGDGYADMYGNTNDGSYASSTLRVNGMGEAFTWEADCNCWARNPAYDGERKERHHHYKEYDYD